MPLYKVTLLLRSQNSGRCWSYSSYRVEDSIADVKTAAEAFLFLYFVCCDPTTRLNGMYVQDQAGGQPKEFIGGSAFTHKQGVNGDGSEFPDANGLLWQGIGGPTRKGISSVLLHAIVNSYTADANNWDLTAADLLALRDGCKLWFLQFREKVSARGYPIVAPPDPFPETRLKPQIFLRRVGRPFSLAGQTAR